MLQRMIHAQYLLCPARSSRWFKPCDCWSALSIFVLVLFVGKNTGTQWKHRCPSFTVELGSSSHLWICANLSPNPTWARGVTCAYQAIRPCVFTANVPAVSDVCVHRKLPMIPELNKLRVFVQVWMCAFVKSFYMFVNLSQSCKQSSFSKEKKWFRKWS